MDWDNLRIFLELARGRRLMDAAERLGIDYSTVSRRIRRFERELGTQLFDRNNQGYTLTAQGLHLVEYAEKVEATMHLAQERLTGHNAALSGQIRLACTEGFGTHFLAAQLAHFCARHPHITLDLLPLSRFVNLPKREADMAITIERPDSGNYAVAKLCDYHLKLYASPDYLAARGPITSASDLHHHNFIGYVDDLVFSAELRYLEQIVPAERVGYRSTNVVAQCSAVRQGTGLAVLPCFLASPFADLVPVLEDQVLFRRSFWLVLPEERHNLARIKALRLFVTDAAERNRAFLLGESREMVTPDRPASPQ
jgi:DNA-binding transcriptional LysR family regulator